MIELIKLTLNDKDELIVEADKRRVQGSLVGLAFVVELPNSQDFPDCERRILDIKNTWSKGGGSYSTANAYLPGFMCEVGKDKVNAVSIQFYKIN